MKKLLVAFIAFAALCVVFISACAQNSPSGRAGSSAASTTASSTTEKTSAATTARTTRETKSTEAQLAPGGQEAVAELAKSLVGSPFKFGAAGPGEFDNSGFLFYCYSQNGIKLPRRTRDIARQGAEVAISDLRPGDAVFFYNENAGSAEYAGIYIGDNQFVAGDNEEKPVSIHKMNVPYFTDRFVCARRFAE